MVGAVDYIHKPFCPTNLKVRVATQINLKDRSTNRYRVTTMAVDRTIGKDPIIIENACKGVNYNIYNV